MRVRAGRCQTQALRGNGWVWSSGSDLRSAALVCKQSYCLCPCVLPVCTAADLPVVRPDPPPPQQETGCLAGPCREHSRGEHSIADGEQTHALRSFAAEVTCCMNQPAIGTASKESTCLEQKVQFTGMKQRHCSHRREAGLLPQLARSTCPQERNAAGTHSSHSTASTAQHSALHAPHLVPLGRPRCCWPLLPSPNAASIACHASSSSSVGATTSIAAGLLPRGSPGEGLSSRSTTSAPPAAAVPAAPASWPARTRRRRCCWPGWAAAPVERRRSAKLVLPCLRSSQLSTRAFTLLKWQEQWWRVSKAACNREREAVCCQPGEHVLRQAWHASMQASSSSTTWHTATCQLSHSCSPCCHLHCWLIQKPCPE